MSVSPREILQMTRNRGGLPSQRPSIAFCLLSAALPIAIPNKDK